MRDMPHAFRMRAVAVRDKGVLLKVTAPAAASVADQIARFASLRTCGFSAVRTWLRAVEVKRDRYVYGSTQIDLATGEKCLR